VARAKQTGRAEARRRHRQAAGQAPEAEAEALDFGERRPNVGDASSSRGSSPARAEAQPTGRPGFASAFRGAYRPANIREDLRLLPQLVRSRAFLAAVGLVLVGAVAVLMFPGYNGSVFAFQLLVLPGSALAPQLVAGFFAPRASYLLGLIVGLVQGIAFMALLNVIASQFGSQLPGSAISDYLVIAFVTGPISSVLFAAAAAWYRRFLALSSPRRAQATRSTGKSGGGRRTGGR
jgi:hypothetical protein